MIKQQYLLLQGAASEEDTVQNANTKESPENPADENKFRDFVSENYYVLKTSDGNKVIDILSGIKNTHLGANNFLSITGLNSVAKIASKFFKTDAPSH